MTVMRCAGDNFSMRETDDSRRWPAVTICYSKGFRHKSQWWSGSRMWLINLISRERLSGYGK
ncbi:hypothetical protein HanRHA438_Chr14g0670641 [Helianthus annuus]|uniref:Uncharacterized protein n=1 Tax=Helianthus annuus TaxID=4232 RepID=A0A251SKR0_HELAN|nr:hypothetical protein HanHA300_Chr14g0537451 [Helianthus annuus]KAJ0661085.1 hypothetical protein HanOQP8_Chr14g0544791 [Helianthus annuus]KAJ0855184.1 hypothetical protein HanRHA438_Chr14g0670641 [Helianthus annuus]